jgi:ATP-binding cassette, subfamily C, bacterial LapB
MSDLDTNPASALEACLIHAAAALNRPLTLAALHAAQTGDTKTHRVTAALRAAEVAGMQAGFGHRALADFNTQLTPAILLMQDDHAVVLHNRLPDNRLSIFDPTLPQGLGEISFEKLELGYTGYAILLRAEHRDDLLAQSAPQVGHWFWASLAQNKWAYTQVMLAAVLANVLGLVISLFTMVVYDRILPSGAIDSLVALTSGVALALIFDFLIKTLRAGFIDRAGLRADMVMGRRIFDNLLDMQMKSKKESTGAISSIMREFETLRDFFTSATLVAIVDLPFVFLFIAVTALIGGPLALVPLVTVILVLIIGAGVQPILSRLARLSFANGQTKQSVLVETISGLESIKAVGAAPQMRLRWEDAMQRQSSHGTRSREITQFAINAASFLQQAAQVVIVVYGAILITQGQTSMGALIACVMMTGRALSPLGQLAQTLTRMNQARMSYRSLNALMASASERPEGRGWISRPRLNGDIDFDNVSFTYPNQTVAAVSQLSFSIKAGERVAVIGRIGSGKSTISRLLLGLYQPDTGQVRVDGIDIGQIDPGDLRRNIGAVLQDIWLFSGTIRENIAVGANRPHDHEILSAAKVAGVDEFVARHPSGYDLRLLERGEGLSGGQKQAITLARALVGKPPILLLDEPTSATDMHSEAALIKRLAAETAGCSLLIVTHRTALLELVDRVIVIEQGRIVADGPKSEMIKPASQKSEAVYGTA